MSGDQDAAFSSGEYQPTSSANKCVKALISIIIICLVICLICVFIGSWSDSLYNKSVSFFKNLDKVDEEDLDFDIRNNINLYNASIKYKKDSNIVLCFFSIAGFFIFLLFLGYIFYKLAKEQDFKEEFYRALGVRELISFVVVMIMLVTLACLIFVNGIFTADVVLETEKLNSVKTFTEEDFMKIAQERREEVGE